MPSRGRVAFLSQSGALCIAVLDWAMQENIGFSHSVSLGNMLNVNIGYLIDHDREIAIVAELQDHGQRKLAGVGRLFADADHTEAEYAVLVADRWHGIGLGSLLTDTCLNICRIWGIRTVTAETAPENHRMLRIFEHRGFTLDHTSDRDVVFCRREFT